MFRKWTTILYFPLAMLVQMISMAAVFCVDVIVATGDCMTAYAVVITALLVIHQVIDVFLFLRVKKFYEAKVTELGGPEAPKPPQTELPPHPHEGANNMI